MGILTNSQILVVGAMVVGPEYFAIIAAALGLTRSDGGSGTGPRPGLAGRAVLRLLAAIVVTFLFGLVIRAPVRPPPFLRGQPVAEPR